MTWNDDDIESGYAIKNVTEKIEERHDMNMEREREKRNVCQHIDD